MKKTILILAILVSISAIAQPPLDSAKVTISIQVRDLEFITNNFYGQTEFEELFDSIKTVIRVANPPTGNTPISVTGYVKDWLYVYSALSSNYLAISSNCRSRVESSFISNGNNLLTSKIGAVTTYQSDLFTEERRKGRNKIRRL